MSLFLHGVGHFHPGNEITNEFLEELDIGTNHEWIMERVGIRSRRTVLPLDYIRHTRNQDIRAAAEAAEYTNAKTGAVAAHLALERANLSPAAIGMVVGGSCAPQTVTPAEACNIAAELGIEATAFDLNSACTSLIASVHLLCGMRPEALPDFVLLVVAERLTCSVDYNDRAAAVLWGDGAAALVVSATVPAPTRIEGSCIESSPAGCDKVVVPRAGHFRQEGRTVQTFAIKRTTKIVKHFKAGFETPGRPFHFVGHQANYGMLETTCRLTDIPPERHHSNVELYGNTAAAGSPSVISQRWDRWSERDDLAVVGVGAGLTWGGFMLRFGESQ